MHGVTLNALFPPLLSLWGEEERRWNLKCDLHQCSSQKKERKKKKQKQAHPSAHFYALLLGGKHVQSNTPRFVKVVQLFSR